MNNSYYSVQKNWIKNARIPTALVWFVIAFISFFFLNSPKIFAQTSDAKVIGKLVDAQSGEDIIGANIFFEGTAIGAASDLDGTFIIANVPPGNYTLIVQMISYAVLKITDFKVESGETRRLDLSLQPEELTTEEVVVEARMINNNEASLLKSRQKSITVSDAISAETISRSGSGDAAEAMKKVTGASVVDGKYVYVRGLGERYSSTQLNGAELPSSDPDKKAFQLDLLPANLLDNIVAVKTFTPDKPGNFSGGIVDVGTKAFPDEFTLKLGLSSAYNVQSSYNDQFLTYEGGSKDWLGFDDGTRDIPEALENPDNPIPVRQQAYFDSEQASRLDEASTAFNSIMDFQRNSVPFDQNLSFSMGNRLEVGKGSAIGYLATMTYSRNYYYYDNGQVGRYTLTDSKSEDLNPELLLSDSKGTSEANLGGLATLVYTINPANKIGGNLFYSRSGISTTRYQSGTWPHQFGLDDTSHVYYNRVLAYMERDIQSYQLNGEHFFSGLFNLSADWSVALAKTSQDEPDRRMLASFERYNPNDTSYVIKGSNWDQPSRYFRYLNDRSNTYNINFAFPFSQWSNLSGKMKFGGSWQDLQRQFDERIFTYDIINNYYNDADGDVSALFAPENSGIIRIDTLSNDRYRYNFGNVITDNSKSKNNYQGDQRVQAFYGMIELPISRKLRFIGGVRYETTRIDVASEDSTAGISSLSEDDLLPSLNLVYQLKENMNIRLAATRTLARPNFRELAPYSTKEFINDRELVGNPDLKRTLIRNYDIRLEWFTRPGEILAISGFYKELENPIELAFSPYSNSSNLIVFYENVPKAALLGAEIEARLGLGYLHKAIQNFSIGTNLSLIKSTVDIEAEELNERQQVDSTVSNTRVLQGQSDYILNIDLSYHNNIGTTASLYYNIFGERLATVSAIITPDVYEQPAAQLDFIMGQRLYSKLALKFAVKNILDASYKEVYRFRGKEYIYSSYQRGLTYSLGLEYSL